MIIIRQSWLRRPRKSNVCEKMGGVAFWRIRLVCYSAGIEPLGGKRNQRKRKTTNAMASWQIIPCYSSGGIDHSGGSDHVGKMKQPTFAKKNDRGTVPADRPLLFLQRTRLHRYFCRFAADTLSSGSTSKAEKNLRSDISSDWPKLSFRWIRQRKQATEIFRKIGSRRLFCRKPAP